MTKPSYRFRLRRNDIEDTAVPFPYHSSGVGKRHCRVLISGNVLIPMQPDSI